MVCRINGRGRLKVRKYMRNIKERWMKSKAGKYSLAVSQRDREIKVFICPVGEERGSCEISKVSVD